VTFQIKNYLKFILENEREYNKRKKIEWKHNWKWNKNLLLKNKKNNWEIFFSFSIKKYIVFFSNTWIRQSERYNDKNYEDHEYCLFSII
jgi:hypothetical protein